jgi:hypothetical protein
MHPTPRSSPRAHGSGQWWCRLSDQCTPSLLFVLRNQVLSLVSERDAPAGQQKLKFRTITMSAPWSDVLAALAGGVSGVKLAGPLFVQTTPPLPPDAPYRHDLNVERRYADHKPVGLRELVQNWRDQGVDVANNVGCPGGLTVERLDAGADVNDDKHGALEPPDGDRQGWRLFALFGHDLAGGRVLLAWLLEERCSGVGGAAPTAAAARVGQGAPINIVMCSCASWMSTDMLRFGHSSRKSMEYAGCFGEGMKVEVNRLASSGVDVRYVTAGTVWRFHHPPTDPHGEPGPNDAFVTDISPVTSPDHHLPPLLRDVVGAELYNPGDTYVCLSGLREPLLKTADFLFLQPGADGMCEVPWVLPRGPILAVRADNVPPLRVLLGEEHAGRIYAHGIFVRDAREDIPGFGLEFGGTVKGGKMGRDRSHIDTRAALEMLPEAVLACLFPDTDARDCWINRVNERMRRDGVRQESLTPLERVRSWVRTADTVVPCHDGSDISDESWSLNCGSDDFADAFRLVECLTRAMFNQRNDVSVHSRVYSHAAEPVLSRGYSEALLAPGAKDHRLAGWAAWSLLSYSVFARKHDCMHVPMSLTNSQASEPSGVAERSELRFLGATPVAVGSLLHRMLVTAPQCPTLDNLWHNSRDQLLFHTPEYVHRDEKVPYELPLPDEMRLPWETLGPNAANLAEELRALVGKFFDDYIMSAAQVRFKAMPTVADVGGAGARGGTPDAAAKEEEDDEEAAAKSKPVIPVWADPTVRPRRLDYLVLDLHQFFPDEVHVKLARQGEPCPEKHKREQNEPCSCLENYLVDLVSEVVAPGQVERRRLDKKIRRMLLSGYVVSQAAAPVTRGLRRVSSGSTRHPRRGR